MTVFFVVIATLPLVLVTALLGSAEASTGASAQSRTSAKPIAVPPLGRTRREPGSSGMPKERTARLAAAELRR